jgi:hypothetical protein
MKSEGAELVGCVAFGLAVALVLAAGYVFDASGALNVEVRYGAGFFPEERWGPGKARRWMQQAGEVELLSEGNPGHVDVGFYAESFRVPRTIQVALSSDVLGTFRVPAGAQIFHVIRGVRLKPGGTALRFLSLEGPDRISAYRGGQDHREVTVAFGPLRVLASGSDEARRMQPSAFPGWDVAVGFLSAEENQGHELRREGRLLEAWDALAPLARRKRAHAITYPLLGLVALAVDDLEGASEMFTRGGDSPGRDVLSVQARRLSGMLRRYLAQSEMIAERSGDPGRALRRAGEVYRAVPLYRSTLARRPCDQQSAYWLGLLLALAERREEAGRHFQCVLQQRPDSADARMLRALEGMLFTR